MYQGSLIVAQIEPIGNRETSGLKASTSLQGETYSSTTHDASHSAASRTGSTPDSK